MCLAQGSSFNNPYIAGTITDTQARAWSTRTGKPARLRDFVKPRQLSAFSDRVEAAMRSDPCYYGEDVPPAYDSYKFWVPLQDGIGVWFPEYLYGCSSIAVRIDWPGPEPLTFHGARGGPSTPWPIQGILRGL